MLANGSFLVAYLDNVLRKVGIRRGRGVGGACYFRRFGLEIEGFEHPWARWDWDVRRGGRARWVLPCGLRSRVGSPVDSVRWGMVILRNVWGGECRVGVCGLLAGRDWHTLGGVHIADPPSKSALAICHYSRLQLFHAL